MLVQIAWIERAYAVGPAEINIARSVYCRRTVIELVAAHTVLIVEMFESTLVGMIMAQSV